MAMCKVCPGCGKQNNPGEMECIDCGYDLTMVEMLDTEKMQASVEDPKQAAKAEFEMPIQSIQVEEITPVDRKLVRVCYCGEENPPQARKCRKCREDISNVRLTPQAEPQMVQQEVHYMLENLRTHSTYQVPCGTTILGKEHALREDLCACSFVSRTHAKITVENGKIFLEDLHSTNHTYVNNSPISSGLVELKQGDEIGLGGNSIQGRRQDKAAYYMVGRMP